MGGNSRCSANLASRSSKTIVGSSVTHRPPTDCKQRWRPPTDCKQRRRVVFHIEVSTSRSRLPRPPPSCPPYYSPSLGRAAAFGNLPKPLCKPFLHRKQRMAREITEHEVNPTTNSITQLVTDYTRSRVRIRCILPVTLHGR